MRNNNALIISTLQRKGMKPKELRQLTKLSMVAGGRWGFEPSGLFPAVSCCNRLVRVKSCLVHDIREMGRSGMLLDGLA